MIVPRENVVMYRPEINKNLLKDDKGYTYLCFSEEPYPRLTVEKNKKKAGTYLGPYMSGYVAREAAKALSKIARAVAGFSSK